MSTDAPDAPVSVPRPAAAVSGPRLADTLLGIGDALAYATPHMRAYGDASRSAADGQSKLADAPVPKLVATPKDSGFAGFGAGSSSGAGPAAGGPTPPLSGGSSSGGSGYTVGSAEAGMGGPHITQPNEGSIFGPDNAGQGYSGMIYPSFGGHLGPGYAGTVGVGFTPPAPGTLTKGHWVLENGKWVWITSLAGGPIGAPPRPTAPLPPGMHWDYQNGKWAAVGLTDSGPGAPAGTPPKPYGGGPPPGSDPSGHWVLEHGQWAWVIGLDSGLPPGTPPIPYGGGPPPGADSGSAPSPIPPTPGQGSGPSAWQAPPTGWVPSQGQRGGGSGNSDGPTRIVAAINKLPQEIARSLSPLFSGINIRASGGHV